MSAIFSLSRADAAEPEVPFHIEIQGLADEELLDIWVQTQSMEAFLSAQSNGSLRMMPGYEQAIVKELQVRTLKRPLFDWQSQLSQAMAPKKSMPNVTKVRFERV